MLGKLDLRPWGECLGEPVLADANRFVHNAYFTAIFELL